ASDTAVLAAAHYNTKSTYSRSDEQEFARYPVSLSRRSLANTQGKNNLHNWPFLQHGGGTPGADSPRYGCGPFEFFTRNAREPRQAHTGATECRRCRRKDNLHSAGFAGPQNSHRNVAGTSGGDAANRRQGHDHYP